MTTPVKIILGSIIPAFFFLVLDDTVGSIYAIDHVKTLSYVVID